MAEKKQANSKKVEAKSKVPGRGRAKTMDKTKAKTKSASKAVTRVQAQGSEPARIVNKISPPRIQNGEERKPARGVRAAHQYNFMKAPGNMYDFQVGDRVEVFCDHEKGRERVRPHDRVGDVVGPRVVEEGLHGGRTAASRELGHEQQLPARLQKATGGVETLVSLDQGRVRRRAAGADRRLGIGLGQAGDRRRTGIAGKIGIAQGKRE